MEFAETPSRARRWRVTHGRSLRAHDPLGSRIVVRTADEIPAVIVFVGERDDAIRDRAHGVAHARPKIATLAEGPSAIAAIDEAVEFDVLVVLGIERAKFGEPIVKPLAERVGIEVHNVDDVQEHAPPARAEVLILPEERPEIPAREEHAVIAKPRRHAPDPAPSVLLEMIADDGQPGDRAARDRADRRREAEHVDLVSAAAVGEGVEDAVKRVRAVSRLRERERRAVVMRDARRDLETLTRR